MSVIVDGFFLRWRSVAKSKRAEWKYTNRIDDTPVAKTKRPPPTYENVRLVARVLSCINAQLIERHFHLDADTARKFMDRLVEEKLFGEISADGWHYPLTRRQPPRRSSAEKTKVKPKVADSAAENVYQPASADELGRRIEELCQEVLALKVRIKRLRSAGKIVIAQREEWKARAMGAERNVVDLTAQSASRPETRDGRFDALRRLIAKELHPDFCDGGGLEKTLRAEFFKKLWPEIERLVLSAK